MNNLDVSRRPIEVPKQESPSDVSTNLARNPVKKYV